MAGRRRLSLEQALLGFLMRESLHGYDLHQRVESELGEIWHMGISNIYGVLKQLEHASLVESDLVPQESHPPRKVYRITAAGRQSFLEWLRQPISAIRDVRIEFPTRLYFFRALGLEGVGELIAAQEAICRERAERLEQRMAERSPDDINRLVYDFRRRQIEAILGWLRVCREEWV